MTTKQSKTEAISWIYFKIIISYKTLFILLPFIVLLPDKIYAQSPGQINLNLKNTPIKKAFQNIEEQTGLSIVYNVNDLDPTQKISIKAKDEKLTSVLNKILRHSGITYTISNKHIVLSKVKNTQNQNKYISITGKVQDIDGEELVGVNILVKKSSIGTVTDIDGYFSLDVPYDDQEIVVSYIGFKTQNIRIENPGQYTIALKEDSRQLAEVVVTAMGIESKSAGLTYSTQIINGNELARIKETNPVNSLQGKSAGLVITPNSTGAGGASKILLRGNTSIMGNNQPLIVIDGIPLQNHQTYQIKSTYGGERDGGDAFSNINPDDVESISILKGASAAALYGSMAANGVIMITTKRGEKGQVRIDVSSNTTFESPLILPSFQNEYEAKPSGPDQELAEMSWGNNMADSPAKNNLKNFFRTGYNLNNSITVSGGSNSTQSYLSYSNTYVAGIMPTNNFMRHILNFKQNISSFDNKLNFLFSGSYVNQKIDNKPSSGRIDNPLTGLYLIPRNDNIQNYSQYEINGTQNWPYLAENNQNPYWVLNRIPQQENRERYILSGQITWKVLDYLKFLARLNLDHTNDYYEKKSYASSFNVKNMRFTSEDINHQQLYADFLATFDKKIHDFHLNFIVGTSLTDINNTSHSIYISDEQSPLYPNFFSPENTISNPVTSNLNRKLMLSLFNQLTLGYKEMANINISTRQDWSSTLVNTNDKSYFYPSFGANIHICKLLNLPETFNLLKIRSSYSIVGNDIPDQITSPASSIRLIMGGGGSLTIPETSPFKELKLERTYAMESGVDMILFNNQFNFDFTYYKTNTKNQLFKVSAPWASGYRYRYLNAGNVENIGFETSASWMQKFDKNWNLTTKITFSYNKNKIKELVKGLEDQKLNEAEGFFTYLKGGGSYGDIYVSGVNVKKDIVTGKDIVTKEVVANQYVGNLESKIHAGWCNIINYKDFYFYFLIDSKFGGNVISITQGFLDTYGVSQASADARHNGGIFYDGKSIDPQQYYATVGQGPFAGSDYVYDATNIRLREASIGYTFRNLFGESKNMNVSLIGRNLFFFYKNAPVDPDISSSTANGWQGIDCFALPTVRSLGINLKLTF